MRDIVTVAVINFKCMFQLFIPFSKLPVSCFTHSSNPSRLFSSFFLFLLLVSVNRLVTRVLVTFMSTGSWSMLQPLISVNRFINSCVTVIHPGSYIPRCLFQSLVSVDRLSGGFQSFFPISRLMPTCSGPSLCMGLLFPRRRVSTARPRTQDGFMLACAQARGRAGTEGSGPSQRCALPQRLGVDVPWPTYQFPKCREALQTGGWGGRLRWVPSGPAAL